MTDNTADFHRITTVALRIARLASLNAPSVILLDAADMLMSRIEQLHRANGCDPDEHRREMTAIRATPLEPMTPEEEAELVAEDARMAAADEAARLASGYSEQEWDRLDHGFRFGLVMDHYPKDHQHG